MAKNKECKECKMQYNHVVDCFQSFSDQTIQLADYLIKEKTDLLDWIYKKDPQLYKQAVEYINRKKKK